MCPSHIACYSVFSVRGDEGHDEHQEAVDGPDDPRDGDVRAHASTSSTYIEALKELAAVLPHLL